MQICTGTVGPTCSMAIKRRKKTNIQVSKYICTCDGYAKLCISIGASQYGPHLLVSLACLGNIEKQPTILACRLIF